MLHVTEKQSFYTSVNLTTEEETIVHEIARTLVGKTHTHKLPTVMSMYSVCVYMYIILYK